VSRRFLVTGAARGLGLEFCRQILAAGDAVVACPRTDGASDLDALASARPDRMRIVPMDVADPASVGAAAAAIDGEAIDVLIHNAGVFPSGGSLARGIDRDAIQTALRVNAIAALEVTEALLPALRRGRERKIAYLTSLMGSIGDNTSGGSYAYRISKAALNMAVRTMAHELAPEGFVLLALHPGWVRTSMGGPGAPLEPEPSIAGMLRVIDRAERRDSGGFRGHDGRDLPW